MNIDPGSNLDNEEVDMNIERLQPDQLITQLGDVDYVDNHQGGDMNIEVIDYFQLEQLLFPSDQTTFLTQIAPIPAVQQPKKRKRRCTTCGHEKHPNCSKRGGKGVCNTPMEERLQYRRSRGSDR